MATFTINVAKENPAQKGKPFGPHYLYHFHIQKECSEEQARELLNEIRSHYPDPEFKVDITREISYGERLDW